MKDGIDPFTLKEIMGHRNLQTTLRYAHLAPQTTEAAVDTLNFGAEKPSANVISVGEKDA